MITLDQLKIGQSAIVKTVGGEGSRRQHFLDMGIIPDARVKLVKFAPLGDPMEILIHGYGRYYVRAYDGPCEVSANIDIPRCPFNLYFPNCITATFDDGVNDFFFMSDPSLVTEFEIWIYDRWGMLVYHSTDPHFQWDGTVNGKVAANNEFTWRAFAKPRTEDKKYEFHGSVLVL